jgi:hypothetical protein
MATDNPLSYVDIDFDSIVQQLIDRLKATGAWKDTYESSTGIVLIDLFAGAANTVHYYIEREAEEHYIDLAQRRSSVINLVRVIGYSPRRKMSATGTLEFSVDTPTASRIYVPAYTEAQTADGLKFVTMSDITIEPGQTTGSVAAIQGALVTLGFTGDGTEGQEYQITDTSVENDTHTRYRPFYAFRVLVDGVEWTLVTSWLESVNSSQHYMMRAELDDTLTLIFGDNKRGLEPTDGAVITVKYIQSDGVDGNVYQTGMVTTLNTTLYDQDGVEVSVHVTNTTTMTGGDDSETTDEIRENAPKVFQTGDRLVTAADHDAFIGSYESVADSHAWGENEENPPNETMRCVVRLCILLDGWNLPTESFKTQLSEDLKPKAYLGTKYEYINAVILDVIAEIDAWIVKGYSLSQAEADVSAALETEFVLGGTTKIGTSKYRSNLIQTVDALNSVSYHHMTLKIRKALAAGLITGSDWSETLDALPILRSSVSFYATVGGIDDVLIASDNGSGSVTSTLTAHSVTGSVDYDTGEVAITVSPNDKTNVHAVYQQDEDGDVIVTNRQICKLYDVDMASIQYVS